MTRKPALLSGPHHFSIQVRPRRLAVQAEHNRSRGRPLIDVVHPQFTSIFSSDCCVTGFKIEVDTLKGLVWRSNILHSFIRFGGAGHQCDKSDDEDQFPHREWIRFLALDSLCVWN